MTDQPRPLVVMIHALGADAHMWDSYAKRLGDRARCLAPNLFGVGETPRHSRPPRAADHAEMLAAEVLGLEGPLVVVGCAVGSMIAAELARRLPGRVAGLIMANPILRITGPAGDALMARAARAREGGIAAIEDEVLGRSFEGIDPARKESFRARLRKMSGEAYADLAEGICGCDIAPALADLTCPLLLVPGGLDLILPDWHPPEIARIVPSASIVRVEEGGHFMPQQAPDGFASATRPFLASVAKAQP